MRKTTRDAPWFKDWFCSPYYDLLYAGRDRREAETFIKGLMQRLSLPDETQVLDVACGNGRHALTLADLGYRVVGIDQSERMIAEAMRHAGARLHFQRHDMRDPLPFGGFGLALNLFTSFGFFDTAEEHHRSIRNISDALNPDGLLVMDYLNTDHVASHLVPEETVVKGDVEFGIERRVEGASIRKTIRILDSRSGDVHRFEENVRAFRLSDFSDMFGSCGMRITDAFGDYDWNPFHPQESPRLVMFVRKR
jgi:SAM-dependent methyltransferase